jgi:hypothetical protein
MLVEPTKMAIYDRPCPESTSNPFDTFFPNPLPQAIRSLTEHLDGVLGQSFSAFS